MGAMGEALTAFGKTSRGGTRACRPPTPVDTLARRFEAELLTKLGRDFAARVDAAQRLSAAGDAEGASELLASILPRIQTVVDALRA